MSPHFYLKKPNQQGQCLIFMTLSLPSGRLKMSCGQTIAADQWDDRKERPKRTMPGARALAKVLDRYETVALEQYRTFVSQGRMPGITELRAAIRQAYFISDASVDVVAYTAQFIQRREKSNKYSRGSISVYNQMLTRLKAFRSVVPFDTVTSEFLQDWIDHMFAQKYEQNTVNKAVSTLKTVLNEATEKGVNVSLRYKSRRGSVGKVTTTKVYLPEGELESMARAALPDSLGRVRDLFLVASYTGVRYSDLFKIGRESFSLQGDVYHFAFEVHKTKEWIYIPAHPVVIRIMEKYDWQLPRLSNPKYNLYLKDMCRACGLTDPVRQISFPGGIRTEKRRPKCDLVTSHTARRSAICNMYLAGLQVETIKEISGHKSHAAFMAYLRLSPSDHLQVAADNRFWKGARIVRVEKAVNM